MSGAELKALPGFSTAPSMLVSVVWRQRQLLWQLTKREMHDRYRGSWLGTAWSFITPLLMLAIYTFVFAVIFRARWGGASAESTHHVAIVLFSGLIVYTLFAECVNRAPGLVLSSPSYVKKVVFPLELLPLPVMGGALFHASVSLIVLLAAMLLSGDAIPPTLPLLPLVVLPLVLATVGAMWFLGSLGVYLRDISQVVALLTTGLLFLAPVFYPVSAVPERYRPLLEFNPLTFVIESARAVIIDGRLPNLGVWTAQLLAGLIIAWGGFAWFQRTRKGFADVL
ncbi:MAG TPA: ABC transporter permease [Burkholderiaceae bacterium]|nr:ABC transporter permease [Burkholderiaceae bacterium]